MSQRALLIILAKAPVLHQVNTRLIPAIGVEAATRLQAELIELRMRQFGHVDAYDVQLWCSPDIDHPVFQQCARENDIQLRAQQGPELGARMVHAFAEAFTAYDRVALVGTDAPAVGDETVSRALDALDVNDVVIAPAEDGGYVLIAMRGFFEQVFESVPWGTPGVLQKTRANIESLALKYLEIETSWDVDRVEDYRRYVSEFGN